jgi:hypothetical protein
MRRIAELFAALQAAVETSHAIRESAVALSHEAAALGCAVPPERRAMPRSGTMSVPQPQQWRRQHNHGRLDKLIQTNRENVEVFVVIDGRHRHVGSAASRQSAEKMLRMIAGDRHHCSTDCGEWEMMGN